MTPNYSPLAVSVDVSFDTITRLRFATQIVRAHLDYLNEHREYAEYVRRFVVTCFVTFYFFGPVIDDIAEECRGSEWGTKTRLGFSENSAYIALVLGLLCGLLATRVFANTETFRKKQEAIHRNEIAYPMRIAFADATHSLDRLALTELVGASVSDMADFIGLWIAVINLATEDRTIQSIAYSVLTALALMFCYPQLISNWITYIRLQHLKDGIYIPPEPNSMTWYTKLSVYALVPASMLSSTLFFGQIIDSIFGLPIDTTYDISTDDIWVCILLAMPISYSMVDSKYQYVLRKEEEICYPAQYNTYQDWNNLSKWKKTKSVCGIVGLGSEFAEPIALTVGLLSKLPKGHLTALYFSLLAGGIGLALLYDWPEAVRHMKVYTQIEERERRRSSLYFSSDSHPPWFSLFEPSSNRLLFNRSESKNDSEDLDSSLSSSLLPPSSGSDLESAYLAGSERHESSTPSSDLSLNPSH